MNKIIHTEIAEEERKSWDAGEPRHFKNADSLLGDLMRTDIGEKFVVSYGTKSVVLQRIK